MASKKTMCALSMLLVAGCSSSDATSDQRSTTVASLLASPPAEGTKVTVDIVVVVAQRNGSKWRAYVQDRGVANGIGLFCDANDASDPCSIAPVAGGNGATLTGTWMPKAASQITPVDFVASGVAEISYASVSTHDVVAKTTPSGTPVRLQGGPWKITDAAPAAMTNPAFVEGDCSSGPRWFGVTLVDESDGTTIALQAKWFDQVGFTVSDAACAAGKTRLAVGQRFTRLGGLVELGGGGDYVIEPFADADCTLVAAEGS